MVGLVSKYRGPLLAACLAGLAACGTLPDPSNPADIAAHVTVTQDQYDGVWKARAPRIIVWHSFDVTSYKLRGWSRDRGFGPGAFAQLYVETDLDEWLYLKRAHSAGVAYDVRRIDREVDRCSDSGCQYNETVGIDMSVDQLRAVAAGPGFDVRLSGRNGSVTFFVPSAYFQGFLIGIGQRPR